METLQEFKTAFSLQFLTLVLVLVFVFGLNFGHGHGQHHGYGQGHGHGHGLSHLYFFLICLNNHSKIFQKMLESRPEDALVKLVKHVKPWRLY